MKSIIINETIIKNALRQSINEMIDEDRIEQPDGTVEVDNFDNVRQIMNFTNPGDTIYFVELIKRGKDNPGMIAQNNKQYIKQYYFKNIDEFNDKEQEIKTLCQATSSRAYIYLNARSKAEIDKWTAINQQRMNKNKHLLQKYNGNAKAWAAGRPLDLDDGTRDKCLIDIDSDDFKDISLAMKIIQDAGIKPLFAYRSMNNGLHIILPNKEDAKKLDFTPIQGNIRGLGKRAEYASKITLEIDKPALLYASLKPQGYDKQRARFNKIMRQNHRHP